MLRLGIPSRGPDIPTEPQRTASLSPGDATHHPLKADWQLITRKQADSFLAALGITGLLWGAYEDPSLPVFPHAQRQLLSSARAQHSEGP